MSASIDLRYVELFISVAASARAQDSYVRVEYVANALGGTSTATLDDFVWHSSGSTLVKIPAGVAHATVRVYARDDRKTEGTEEAYFRLVQVPGGPTVQTGANGEIEVTVFDTSQAPSGSADPNRGVVLSPTVPSSARLGLPRMDMEAGSTATYTVRLASAPSDTVTIRAYVRTSRDPNISIVGSNKFTFTTTSWSVPQTVTVTAPAGGAGKRHIIDHLAFSDDTDYSSEAYFYGVDVDRSKNLLVTVTASTQGGMGHSLPPIGVPTPDQNPPHVGPSDELDPADEPDAPEPDDSPDEPSELQSIQPANEPAQQPYAGLIAQVRQWRDDPQWSSNKAHTDRWDRVLLALGVTVADTSLTAMGAAEAQGYADRGWTRWTPVAEALAAIESG